jgi:hypothetical protein
MLYNLRLTKGEIMDKIEPPKKKRLFPGIPKLALLIVVLLGIVLILERYSASQHSQDQQVQVNDTIAVFDSRLQNLEKTTARHDDRIRELEETTHKLASAPPPAPAAAPATAPAESPASAAAPAPAADDARIEKLEKEIEALKASAPMQTPEGLGQSIRLLLAFHRFSGKVLSGKPFAAELSAFEELDSPDESAGSPLATLAPFAGNGIPTFATLLASFDVSVDGLNAAQAIPPADAGFAERLKYNLTHMVSVRRISEGQTGNSVQAIVGRAQAHLEREEIEAAMTEIKSLPESARGNFSSWLDDAQMVTEAPSLIDQIEEEVMQKAFHTEGKTSGQNASPAPVKPAKTDVKP